MRPRELSTHLNNIFSAEMTYSHGCVIGFRETEFLSSRLPVLGAGSTIACEPGTKAIGDRLGNGLSPSVAFSVKSRSQYAKPAAIRPLQNRNAATSGRFDASAAGAVGI